MLAITTLLAAAISPVSAQRLVHLGVGGGVSVPVGTFHDTYSAKENATVILTAGSQDSWLGTRLDYSYNEFTGRDVLGKQYHGTHLNIITADLVASFPLGWNVKPYLVGGGGWYQHRDSGDVKWRSGFGINGGVGFTFPFLTSAGFMEARYHRIYGRGVSQQFVPITFGVVF
jgi:hypothetical protein